MNSLGHHDLLYNIVLEQQAELQQDAALHRLLASQRQAGGMRSKRFTTLVERIANLAERLKVRQQATA
mgnify:CR=1 FL=1